MGLMVSRGIGMRSALVGGVAATVLVSSACGSDGGGSGPAAPPSSSDASSASVAAGVVKDSVLDLNSTKDMTGVVTTVSIGKSPYDKNMPDICGFITQSAMDALGVETKKKGFSGSPLVYQACLMAPPTTNTNDSLITAEIYVNSLSEHLSLPNLKREGANAVPLFRNVIGYQLRDTKNNDVGGPYSCEIAWGTFFGTAALNLTDYKSEAGLCDRALGYARVVGPLMPKSPSEMRPSS